MMEWPADNQPSSNHPIYTRGNVGEVFPDVVLPLEWELGGPPSEEGWRRGAEAVGFLTPDDYGPDAFVLNGVFGGYAYFNVSLMRLLGVRAPGMTVELIDQQFLGDAEDIAPYEPAPGDRNLRASARVVRTVGRTLTAKRAKLLEPMRRQVAICRSLAPGADGTEEQQWQFLRQRFPSYWSFMIEAHVVNTMQATIAAGALTDFCEKNLGDPALAVALTTGLGDVVSAQPAAEMWRLANDTSDADFDAAFAEFLRRFGHRGPNEFSIAARDWGAHPEVAVAMIDSMRGVNPERSPAQQQQRMAEEQRTLAAKVRNQVGRRAPVLDRLIASTAMWSRAREESKDLVIQLTDVSRIASRSLFSSVRERGGCPELLGPVLLTMKEMETYMADPGSMLSTIQSRTADHAVLSDLEPPFSFDARQHNGSFPPVETWAQRAAVGSAAAHTGDQLAGIAGAPGTYEGIARVVTDPGDPTALEPGDILVAPLTDPSWTPLFVPAGAVVVEVGAAMSHAVIVSRELGLPCVVGVERATLKIVDGTRIRVDGHTGTVTIL